MRKSTFAIILAAVVALCVPAVAFAALAPNPLDMLGLKPVPAQAAVQPAPKADVPPAADESAPRDVAPAPETAPAPEQDATSAPEPRDNGAAPDSSGNGGGNGYHHPDRHNGFCDGYVDADGDGVCDSCGADGARCPNFVDENGDGVCDTYHDGGCPGYADGDGDGICDNCEGNGSNCPGYVDADGNGVCDNYGNGCGRGYGDGAGNGRHHGGGHGHGCMR